MNSFNSRSRNQRKKQFKCKIETNSRFVMEKICYKDQGFFKGIRGSARWGKVSLRLVCASDEKEDWQQASMQLLILELNYCEVVGGRCTCTSARTRAWVFCFACRQITCKKMTSACCAHVSNPVLIQHFSRTFSTRLLSNPNNRVSTRK